MGYAVFVVGPAGSGKTTFCRSMVEHGSAVGRHFRIINLDPASIDGETEYAADIREYVTLEEVLENTDLGPNGGLVLTMKEFAESICEFEIEDLCRDYLLFDCPGQIELFISSDAIPRVANHVKKYARIILVYLMEAPFLLDPHKYVQGCLTSFLTMFRFEAPHMNIMTKIDLMPAEWVASENTWSIRDALEKERGAYTHLSIKIHEFLEENGMLAFRNLDWGDEECVLDIVYEMDTLLEYWSDAEPRERGF